MNIPDESSQGQEPLERQYRIVKKSIEYLRKHVKYQPSLSQLAREVHLSEFHLQRVFTDWAGISPKKFLQYLTKEYALSALTPSISVEQSALDLGLSSPSRLHDLMIKCVAMTPGEVKAAGKGVHIKFGHSLTPFGLALIGWTDKGVCHLMFNDVLKDAQEELRLMWPSAQFSQDCQGADHWMQRIFFPGTASPHTHPHPHPQPSLQVLLKGTEFQMKVWEALLKTPARALTTYGAVAQQLGAPSAHRAVGTAIGKNTVAYLIPCHRVIRASGEFSEYRWGVERKMAMIGREAALQA